MNGNAFIDNFLLFYFFNFSTSFCLDVFFFFLHFCLLSHFEMIRYIVKSLSLLQRFFVEMQLKKENLTSTYFLGARVWALKPVYWPPKQPGYVTESSFLRMEFVQSYRIQGDW